MNNKITDANLYQDIEALRKSAHNLKNTTRRDRARFWVHDYLTEVYGLFLKFGSNRSGKRRIKKLFDLHVSQAAHPIRILIEASLPREDNRAKGRWCQALKWAHKCGVRPNKLGKFFVKYGGVSGCAAQFAAFRANKSQEMPRVHGGSGESSVGSGESQMANVTKSKYLRDDINCLRGSARHNLRGPEKRVLDYLCDVYGVFLKLETKGRATKAARRIAQAWNLSIREKTHLARVLIEASAGTQREGVKEQWAYALRFAIGWNQPAARLKWFVGSNDGIAGCACEFEFLRICRRRKSLRNMGVMSYPLATNTVPDHISSKVTHIS